VISIIICSRNPELFAQVSENIRQTIGLPFEIIRIDNQANRYGICEAYNLGAAQARYDFLCFSHEDLLFHTSDWGRKVVDILNDKTVGLLGVVGSGLQPSAPAAWWDTGDQAIRKRIFQRYPQQPSQEDCWNPKNEKLATVAVVDGLWLSCRKEVWTQYPFDQQTFKGFHFYDHDFSLQIGQAFRVCLSYEILIEHFSLGNLNEVWFENMIIFDRKWRKKLPRNESDYSPEEINEITYRIKRNFATRLIDKGFDKKIVRPYAWESLLERPSDRQNHWFMVWLFEQYFPNFYIFVRTIYRKVSRKQTD
jgi:Glycosyltransferase like family